MGEFRSNILRGNERSNASGGEKAWRRCTARGGNSGVGRCSLLETPKGRENLMGGGVGFDQHALAVEDSEREVRLRAV
jgi:predicted ABC-type transport system involved in lysophospholipase L1 biosynthesis ATPase subunit